MDPRITRRSARLEAQRPRYPIVEQTTAAQGGHPSAFNSSSSLSSMSSVDSSAEMSHTYGGQSFGGQSFGGQSFGGQPFGSQSFDAPLPSPIQPQQSNYFGHFQSAQPQAQPPRMQQPYTSPYMGQKGGMGGLPETVPFLNNVNLIAEAAKRAQMACLMRDLGDVSL